MAVQQTVNHRGMHRTPDFLLIGAADRSHRRHLARWGLFEKRSQQFLLLCQHEILMGTAGVWLAL
jgi:hypothetical protein